MEDPAPYIVKPSPDACESVVSRLLRCLGREGAALLAKSLEDVETKTGHGEIKLVVSDGRVTLIKPSFSFKVGN